MDTGALQLVIVTGALGWLTGAVLVAASAALTDVRRLEPSSRTQVLQWMAWTPLLTAVLFCFFGFSPSVLAVAGLVADHCLVHAHHAFHLCLVHAGSAGPLAIVAAFAVLGGVAARAGWKVLTGFEAHRRVSRVLSLSRPEAGGWWELESARPFAFTTGFLQPRIVISSGLIDSVSEDDLDVVVAHERFHASRRHGLARLIMMFGSVLQLPRVGGWLRSEHSLACEQAADGAAAEVVGCPIRVAEVLLRVERLLGPAEAAVGFADADLESRVTALLAEHPGHVPGVVWPVFGAAVLMLGIVKLEWLHHELESFIALLV